MSAGPSPSTTGGVGPAPPGYFTQKGKHYRSTALTLYVFTLSHNSIFDSGAVTRSTADGHVPVLSSDGDRKELGKMILGSEFHQWTLDSTPPQFGVQTKMDIIPHYEGGVFRFVHIVISTILEDMFTRHGAMAPAVKLTMYTPRDYFLWLNNLPFLRMLLNRAVTVTSGAMGERSRVKTFSLRGYKALEEEAKRLAGLVKSFLSAKCLLPAVTARPKRTMPAPHAFLSEYGSTVAEALSVCLKRLGTQPEFLSAIIAGCIACSNWVDYIGGGGGRDAVGRVNYSHYYCHELPVTRVSRSAKVVEDGWAEDDTYMVKHAAHDDDDDRDSHYLSSESTTPRASAAVLFPSENGGQPSSPQPQPQQPVTNTVGQSRKPFTHVPGGAWQASRIVVIGPEWRVMPILMVCIFFYKRGRLLSSADPSRFTSLFGDAAEDLLPSYIAAQTDELSTAYAIQWLEREQPLTQDEYDVLFDPTNDEGNVLVIDVINEKATRYELEKAFLEPGEMIGPNNTRYANFGSFRLTNVNALELHADETILAWLDEANYLSGTCAIDLYLQEQLALTYQRAMLYEQLVRGGMLDPYDFNIGFVSVKPPPKPAKGGKGLGVGPGQGGMPVGSFGGALVGGADSLPSTSQRGHLTANALSSRNAANPLMSLARPDVRGVSDDDTQSEGGTSTGSSSFSNLRGFGLRGKKASMMAGVDDDAQSSSSSIAPSPLMTVQDAQTRVWMLDVKAKATEEECFIIDHRLRVESMLGPDCTPSHGQLLHLLRFQQPQSLATLSRY